MKTILICGHGPGISDAVARRFGAEGFAVGLVARNADRLAQAAAALEASGIKAAALPADLADSAAVTAVVGEARRRLGPVTVVHWNAYAWGGGDLTKDELAGLRTTIDVSVTSLVAALQAALPDLRAQPGSAAVLVTNGGLSFYDPKIDAMAVQWNAMGLAVGKAAQHKLVGVLHQRLKPEDIYVGEAVVLGTVAGTAFDRGQGPTLDPATIAGRFWELYSARSEASVQVR